MSLHIDAEKGDIASTVLLPGDPLRAKFIAETYLEESYCYNNTRGMYGYTGRYKGKLISVQGTGIGIPSISIYAYELINRYNVENLIRIGSCGSLQSDIKVRDIILAISASTDSSFNKLQFNNMDYAPTASYYLLKKTELLALQKRIQVKIGSVFTTDMFYHDNENHWKIWADYGSLAIEMETAALYTIAAKFKVNALSILTVSDSLVTGEKTTAEEREKTFTEMAELAIETA
ncbi:MAG: purine-nucleoside phosphorylase [Atribacterota bacterium]|nr:purine-nucleoside phosphorylase [Atribacterota bacterium]